MATVPDEEEGLNETFAEAFPGFVRTVVTGKPTGIRLDIVVLFIVITVCLISAPLPFSAIGIVAGFLLNLRWRWV